MKDKDMCGDLMQNLMMKWSKYKMCGVRENIYVTHTNTSSSPQFTFVNSGH